MIHFLLDWLGYWIVRVTAFVVQRLPLDSALAWGQGLGRVVYFFTSRHRVAYANLKTAFPESTVQERKRWTKEMFQQLGMSAIEMMRSPILKMEYFEQTVTNHGYENYLACRQSGKGLILLTAHVGNWELSQIVEGVRGRTMTVLARKQKYKRLDNLLNSFRQYHGSVTVGKGAGIRDLIRNLRRGETVGVLGDQSGGDDGIWVRFFGRLTTSPRGPMALALKFGFKVIPVFFVRRKGPYHDLIFEPTFELVRTGDREKDIQANTQRYIQILESYLRKYPAQWLWGHKRWKRNRTKRITILSDGKPGHIKQSEALVKEMLEAGAATDPPHEMPVEKIEVEFRSAWRKKIFSFFTFFFIPWAQGRLTWLRLFLTPECVENLERTNPSLIVSTGASLAPLNLCLAKENLAKSVVLMKPSFPFDLFRYDLALIPAHDRGWMPRGHFRIQGAFSGLDKETLEISKEKLGRTIRDPQKIRFSLFLGGETRKFRPSVADVESLLAELEQAGEKIGGDYLITTSRRTPESINRFLRNEIKRYPRCQFCVFASEDKRPEVVPAMMALADHLIVTEDSLSMISETLSSGKNVVVVKMDQNGLPGKHYRFQERLSSDWGVPVVEIKKLSEVLVEGKVFSSRNHFDQERKKIREKLGSLL